MKIVILQFPHVLHDLMNRLNFGKLLNFPKEIFSKNFPLAASKEHNKS